MSAQAQYVIEKVSCNSFTHRGFEISAVASEGNYEGHITVKWDVVTYAFEQEGGTEYPFYSAHDLESLEHVFKYIEEFEKTHTRKTRKD